ncbi:hypothetical protein BJ912DRAFT_1058509 [Pholiota molesta]|nr:hypothetical protein BJ912DRAFT_1058509 [Pholiota molesta]
MAAAYGLKELELPKTLLVTILSSHQLIDTALLTSFRTLEEDSTHVTEPSVGNSMISTATPAQATSANPIIACGSNYSPPFAEEDEVEEPTAGEDIQEQYFEDEENASLKMLEDHSALLSEKQRGKQHAVEESQEASNIFQLPSSNDFILQLKELVESPPDIDNEYTRIKKDLFHAFHMIPTPVNHGLRATYSRSLRDHIMQWDPKIRATMLVRNPRFIMERTPRYVPPPSILVPAISHVFNTFGNASDAKTGAPLFNKVAWQKANAVLDLARQGYLSDNTDIVLYEKAGVDKHGLQKWKCLRGTNNVEGGPHGDIYRKFGALHAGPRLTVNCLTDHRTWYNLQAYAKHVYGMDWEYHHDLALINRTSFLLNYLSDVVNGARSYSDWINGDLYERTNEQFGICKFPDSLRLQLAMETFEDSSTSFTVSASDDWLRRRQGLALPILPPTTLEARQYFFMEIGKYAATASKDGKKAIDYSAFAQEWNRSADGKSRCYITPEVLAAYTKTWEKNTNIKASQDLIADALDSASKTSQVFAATHLPFPDFLTALPASIHPLEGVLESNSDSFTDLPSSISTNLAVSHSKIVPPTPIPAPSAISESNSLVSFFGGTQPTRIEGPSAFDGMLQISAPPSLTPTASIDSFTTQTQPDSEPQRPAKRRRVVPEAARKRSTPTTTERELDPENPNNPPPQRKPGRPKGSKDGPRSPNAPKRGRRPKENVSVAASVPDIHAPAAGTGAAVSDSEDEYGMEMLSQEELLALYEMEQVRLQQQVEAPEVTPVTPEPMHEPVASMSDVEQRPRKQLTLEQLRDAAVISQSRPFFSHRENLSINYESEDEFNGDEDEEKTSMMNKAIERDEADANQHTACLAPDQIAIDDSHKVNKHIAKVDGVPIFNALWTCMDSRYIRAQALTLTKAHDE